MAQLIPTSPRALAAHPSAIREIETLEVLARELPDEYRIFHGVHWTRLKDRFTIYGEVDFAVVAPSGPRRPPKLPHLWPGQTPAP